MPPGRGPGARRRPASPRPSPATASRSDRTDSRYGVRSMLLSPPGRCGGADAGSTGRRRWRFERSSASRSRSFTRSHPSSSRIPRPIGATSCALWPVLWLMSLCRLYDVTMTSHATHVNPGIHARLPNATCYNCPLRRVWVVEYESHVGVIRTKGLVVIRPYGGRRITRRRPHSPHRFIRRGKGGLSEVVTLVTGAASTSP